MVSGYVERHGFGVLAQRYAANLANGRFLWRNRVGAESVEVQVSRLKQGAREHSWRFDALSYSLRGFDPSGDNDEGLKALAAQIEAGLAGEPSTYCWR